LDGIAEFNGIDEGSVAVLLFVLLHVFALDPEFEKRIKLFVKG
jgi:hypothetical protein